MSWKEDTRSKTKRNNMRQFKKQHYRNISHNSKESTSSPPIQRLDPQLNRGLIDIADSSDDRFSFRSNNVRSNWSPMPSDDETNEQMRAGDFEILQKIPTGSSYTQLSSEKHWETDLSDTQDNTINDKLIEKIPYFTLNLGLINAGLETIPFYKRMDYPNSMFDREEIRRMNLEAEYAEQKYKLVLNNYEQGISIEKPDSGKSRKSNSAKSQKSVKSNNPADVIKEQKEIDDGILNENENKISKLNINEDVNSGEVKDNPPPSPAIVETKTDPTTTENKDNVEEIQQWLDQILE